MQYAQVDASWAARFGPVPVGLIAHVMDTKHAFIVDSLERYRRKKAPAEPAPFSVDEDIDDDLGITSMFFAPLCKDYDTVLIVWSPMLSWFPSSLRDRLEDCFCQTLQHISTFLPAFVDALISWELTQRSFLKEYFRRTLEWLAELRYPPDVLEAVRVDETNRQLLELLKRATKHGPLISNVLSPHITTVCLQDWWADSRNTENVRQMQRVYKLKEGIGLFRAAKDYVRAPKDLPNVAVNEAFLNALRAYRNVPIEHWLIEIDLLEPEVLGQEYCGLRFVTPNTGRLSLESYAEIRQGVPSARPERGWGLSLLGNSLFAAEGWLDAKVGRRHNRRCEGIDEYRRGLSLTMNFKRLLDDKRTEDFCSRR
jgi:hypothetical protein